MLPPNHLPHFLRNLRAKMWPILQFMFWGSTVILALGMLFFWDESPQSEKSAIGEKSTSTSKASPDNKVFGSQDNKQAINSESLLLPQQEDLDTSDVNIKKEALDSENKGLFEEILSNTKEADTTKTLLEGKTDKKAVSDKVAKEVDKQPLPLPINEGKQQNFFTANSSIDVVNPNSLQSILPTSGLPSSAELYKAMTGFDYSTTSDANIAAAAALANPLLAAIQRNQANSPSLSTEKSVANISNTPKIIQPTYPTALSWQTQTPNLNSFTSLASPTPQLPSTLFQQVSPLNNNELSNSTSLTPDLTPTTPPPANANSYSYLIGSKQDRLGINTAEQTWLSNQVGNSNSNNLSSDSTGLGLNGLNGRVDGRLSSPYSGVNQGKGWNWAPTMGYSSYPETTPGKGWVSAPPASPLLPNQSFSSNSSSSENSLIIPPPAVESTASETRLIQEGNRVNTNTNGMPQVTIPIAPANRQSPLPSFNQDFNQEAITVPTPQPTPTLNNSLPRPIPGRYIGGGQINTFSNP